MHGSLISPTLYNVVVDNFIQTWLEITVEYQRVAHNGMGESSGHYLGVFTPLTVWLVLETLNGYSTW